MKLSETRVKINTDSDIVTARQQGRALAEQVGFSGSEQTIIATAISEVARNIVEFAKTGEIVITVEEQNGKPEIDVVAQDEGPGIPDIARAIQDVNPSEKVPGLGLSGVRRLMDRFEIVSEVGKGTTVKMKKLHR